MYSLWYSLGKILVGDDFDRVSTVIKNHKRSISEVEGKKAFPTNPRGLGSIKGAGRRYILSRYEVGELCRIVSQFEVDLTELKKAIQNSEAQKKIDWGGEDDCCAILGCCCMDWMRREEMLLGHRTGPFVLTADNAKLIQSILIHKVADPNKPGSQIEIQQMMDDFDHLIWYSPCGTGETHEDDFNYPKRPKYYHRH